jgi:hypothetical protein
MQIICPVKLTEREQAFVKAICFDGLAPTVAALASGHAMSTARLLLNRPHVQAAFRYVAENAITCLGRWEKREAKRAAKRQRAA